MKAPGNVRRKQKTLVELLELNGFNKGRMISWSKSGYAKQNPDNFIVYNAKIYDKLLYKEGQRTDSLYDEKVWGGDLDLTKDLKKLYDVITRNDKNIVITYEFGRKILELGDAYK